MKKTERHRKLIRRLIYSVITRPRRENYWKPWLRRQYEAERMEGFES